jgi:hypothetical protein
MRIKNFFVLISPPCFVLFCVFRLFLTVALSLPFLASFFSLFGFFCLIVSFFLSASSAELWQIPRFTRFTKGGIVTFQGRTIKDAIATRTCPRTVCVCSAATK